MGEVWHCPLVSCLSVQVLKALNSRSSVRELSLEDLYHNALLCNSCFASLFNCCNKTYIIKCCLQCSSSVHVYVEDGAKVDTHH